MNDIASKITRYESGEMDLKETLEFYADLYNSNVLKKLQIVYGRAFRALMDAGYITIDNGQAIAVPVETQE